MGRFRGASDPPGSAARFHTRAQFDANLLRQTTMTPQTLEQLREYGVSENSELMLEYFFYTDDRDKAASLHEALMKRGYAGDYRHSTNDDAQYVVTGWTVPIRMKRDAAVQWTESMCRLGFEHDADVDGWGTNPRQ